MTTPMVLALAGVGLAVVSLIWTLRLRATLQRERAKYKVAITALAMTGPVAHLLVAAAGWKVRRDVAQQRMLGTFRDELDTGRLREVLDEWATEGKGGAA